MEQTCGSQSRVFLVVYALIALMAAVVLAAMGTTYVIGTRLAAVHAPLADAAMEIKLEASLAHLWFEEAVEADSEEDRQKALKHIERAKWFANAMIKGGQSDEGRFVPLTDPNMIAHIRDVIASLHDFEQISQQRWLLREEAGVGTEIDQRYDAVFTSFTDLADVVETQIQNMHRRDLRDFRHLQLGLMTSSALLLIAVGVFFSNFLSKQVRDALNLAAANQQLEAANQQLRATEQQLRAANQQLETTNRDLSASEQQLRAANQQLAAGEQQLRAANQQLEANNQQLRAQQEEIAALAKFPSENPNPVLRVDPGGEVIYANQAADDMLSAWSVETGKKLPAQWCKFAAKVVETGTPEDVEVQVGNRWLSLTLAPVVDLGYINIYGLDITARKKSEEQASRTRADLEHTSRLVTVGEMASGMAHELNQPLCAILNYANTCIRTLKNSTRDAGRLMSPLEQIAFQANRAGEIIRRLRNLVGKREAGRSSVHINKLVHEVVQLQRSEAAHRSIAVKTDLADDLPMIHADSVQIEQVLLNLVRNGLESMEGLDDPSRKLMLIRTSTAPDNGVQVSVIDRGKGFVDRDPQKVFDSFYTTKSKGLGIGLSLSRSIIESHQGRIWAEQNDHAGATLSFILPTPLPGDKPKPETTPES